MYWLNELSRQGCEWQSPLLLSQRRVGINGDFDRKVCENVSLSYTLYSLVRCIVKALILPFPNSRA